LKTQGFKKSERLASRTIIKEVFEKGKSFSNYPLKIVFLETNIDCKLQVADCKLQILISVPKRNFKKAVDRNKIKRRIREAYRKNKLQITDCKLQIENPIPRSRDEIRNSFAVMLIYAAKEIVSYKEIEKSVIGLLGKIKNEFTDGKVKL